MTMKPRNKRKGHKVFKLCLLMQHPAFVCVIEEGWVEYIRVPWSAWSDEL
jgi:hypothetical protein